MDSDRWRTLSWCSIIEGEIMQDRTTICLVAMGIVAGLQVTAWLLGQNGQITTMATAVITAILGFFTGINFTEAYTKKQ